MKKSVYFLALIFVLTACDHARNYEEIKQDSKECVLDFIKAVNDNKDRFGDITFIGFDPFITAKRNNPHWDPLKVEFEEDVDTVVKKNGVLDYVIVHAKHQGVAAKFKVCFWKENDESKGRAGKPNILETFNFINFDFAKYKKENGFEIIRKADSDVHFAYLCNKATNAVETVKKYIGSIKSGHKGTTYYPSSNKLPLKADSLLYTAKVKSITISNNDIYNICYTNDVIFYVQIDKPYTGDFTITNSLGLYPFEEKLRLLNEKHHTNLELQRPDTDAGCIAALQRAESNIQDEIARQKGIEFWTSKGLAIISFRDYLKKEQSGFTTYNGKGVEMEFLNPTTKTIKYINLYIRPKNRVGDYYGQPIKYSAVGPILPLHTGSLSTGYLYEDDPLVDKIETSIEILYDDGSKKMITNKDNWRNRGCKAEWW